MEPKIKLLYTCPNNFSFFFLCSFTGNVLSTDPASGMIHIYDDCISIFFIVWFRSGPHFYWDVLVMHLSFYNSQEFLSWCFVFCPETLESQHMQNIIIIILLSLKILSAQAQAIQLGIICSG